MGKSSRNGGFDMFFNRRRNYHFEFDEAPKFQMIYGTYMDIYIYTVNDIVQDMLSPINIIEHMEPMVILIFAGELMGNCIWGVGD